MCWEAGWPIRCFFGEGTFLKGAEHIKTVSGRNFCFHDVGSMHLMGVIWIDKAKVNLQV